MADDPVGTGTPRHPLRRIGDHRWAAVSGVATVAGLVVAVWFGWRGTPATPPSVITPDHRTCHQGDGNRVGMICGDQNSVVINADEPDTGTSSGGTRALPRQDGPMTEVDHRDDVGPVWRPVRTGITTARKAAKTSTTEPASITPAQATAAQVTAAGTRRAEPDGRRMARFPGAARRLTQLDGLTGVPEPWPLLVAIRDGRLALTDGPDGADVEIGSLRLEPLNGSAAARPDAGRACGHADFQRRPVPVAAEYPTDVCVRNRLGDVHHLRVVPRLESPKRPYPLTVKVFAD